MALNPFFLQGSSNEQFLVQDLINEQLKIYGIEVYYLPRKVFKTDNIIKEIQSSKFDDSFLIEAYLNNYDGYAPDSDIMTKFGLRLKNEINLTISRERYEEFIAPFLNGIQSGLSANDANFAGLITRPKEGDLIYFPLGERLFEIKRVESEKPFYQLGTNYVYELSCELYEYENELIDTSIEEVDSTVEDEGYITSLTLIRLGESTPEFGTVSISSGAISEIFLNDDGSGYSSTPTVIFSNPPNFKGGDNVAEAVAITTNIGNVQSIQRLEITNAGSGYITPPTITISGGGGSGAAATCSVGGTQFSVSEIEITGSGRGYISPVVTIAGPGTGVTATAVAILNSNTQIESIRILKPGIGYTEAPAMSITGLPAIGIGTYVYNETITGETSGTTAVVRDFRIIESTISGVPDSAVLRVSLNTGEFSSGEVVVGSIATARYVVENYNSESYDNPYDSNEEFELEADNILDFSESNPFGTY